MVKPNDIQSLLRQCGGIYKRIDEIRELLSLLHKEAPDFLSSNPWAKGWILDTDTYLVGLEQVVEDPSKMLFKPRDDFPRQFPQMICRRGHDPWRY